MAHRRPARQAAQGPAVSSLVYSAYRDLLRGYNDQSNAMLAALPPGSVTEDRGTAPYVHAITRQQTDTMSSDSAVPPPPPPPPPPPASGTMRPKAPPPRVVEPPACVQNAMLTKDKKPFTYTPGGIDLSQIRSPRMARRIERNAHSEGIGASRPMSAAPPNAATLPVASSSATPPPPPMIFAPQPPPPTFVPPPTVVPQPSTPSFVPQPATPTFVSHPPTPSFVPQPPTPSFVPQPPTPTFVPQPPTPPFVPQPPTPSFVQSPTFTPPPQTSPSPMFTPPQFATAVSPTGIRNSTPSTPYVNSPTPTKAAVTSSKAPEYEQPRSQVGTLYIPPLQTWPRETPTSEDPKTPVQVVPTMITLNKAPTPWLTQKNEQPEMQPAAAWARQDDFKPKGPVTRIIPIQVEGREAQPRTTTMDSDRDLMNRIRTQVDEDSVLHSGEVDPRYRGAAIPSRAFRMLQTMTGSGNEDEEAWGQTRRRVGGTPTGRQYQTVQTVMQPDACADACATNGAYAQHEPYVLWAYDPACPIPVPVSSLPTYWPGLYQWWPPGAPYYGDVNYGPTADVEPASNKQVPTEEEDAGITAPAAGLQAIRSVTDVRVYGEDNNGDSANEPETKPSDTEQDSDVDDSETDEDTDDDEDREDRERTCSESSDALHLPHQLSVIMEEENELVEHDERHEQRESSVATTTTYATVASEEDSSVTIGDEDEEVDCPDEPTTTVTIRLPLRLSFGRSDNNKEMTVTVGNASTVSSDASSDEDSFSDALLNATALRSQENVMNTLANELSETNIGVTRTIEYNNDVNNEEDDDEDNDDDDDDDDDEDDDDDDVQVNAEHFRERDEDQDSGVNSDDISRHVSETDTESDCFPELRRMPRYQRAATHSRLFKLLQDECSDDEEEKEEDDDMHEMSYNQVKQPAKEMSDLTYDSEATKQIGGSALDRRAHLSLPLGGRYDASEPESFSSSGFASPASPTINDRLVRELVQSLLRKEQRYRSVPLERLHAAACKALADDGWQDEPASDSRYTDDYRNYYNSWAQAGRSAPRCPRMAASSLPKTVADQQQRRGPRGPHGPRQQAAGAS